MRKLAARLKHRVCRLASRATLDTLALRRRALRSQALVAFEADWLGLYPFIRPLLVSLAVRPETSVVVVTRTSEVNGIRKLVRRDAPSAGRLGTVISFETMSSSGLKPSLLISCQPFSQIAPELFEIPKIQLLHGMADKRGELFGRRNLSDFSHLFSPAPVVTELARKRLIDDISRHPADLQIVEIGCPKTDDLFDGTFRRDEVLRQFGLPTDRPTVLYAPTWEKEASLEQYGEEIVTALAHLNINLLVKPHPMTLSDRRDRFLIANGHGGKDWPQTLRNWERRFANVRWVRDAYANPYLVAADLLVSEGSGVALEFVLLDKPIVFVDTPLVYHRHGIDNLHYNLRRCGLIIRDIGDLQTGVMSQLRQPTDMAANRKELIRRLAYNPGQATDIAAAALEHLLDSRP